MCVIVPSSRLASYLRTLRALAETAEGDEVRAYVDLGYALRELLERRAHATGVDPAVVQGLDDIYDWPSMPSVREVCSTP